MIVARTDAGAYHKVNGGALEDAAGNKYPVKDAAEAKTFLRAHPDRDYILGHGMDLGEKLDGPPDPENTLLCGYVRYDSAAGRVVCHPKAEIR